VTTTCTPGDAAVNRPSRRSFVRLGLAAAGAALVPGAAFAAPAAAPRERALSFFNTHTGERLRVTYCCDGRYRPEALRQINHILRDFRLGEVKEMDVNLLDLLSDLSLRLGSDEPFHVISGYRSPRTNAMLRARGGAVTGVAGGSLHMVGKAIDIRVPGVKLDRLRAAALSLKRGGVGYYPDSDFVHVDTGRVRFW